MLLAVVNQRYFHQWAEVLPSVGNQRYFHLWATEVLSAVGNQGYFHHWAEILPSVGNSVENIYQTHISGPADLSLALQPEKPEKKSLQYTLQYVP